MESSSKRNKIDHHREESQSPSSSTPAQESSDPLLIPDFPDELVIEILSRLPAKALVKFKCVSRSWLSLISTQGFIKAHLAVASGRDDYRHHSLLFTGISSRRRVSINQCSIDSVTYAPTAATTTEVTNIHHPMKISRFWVLGSCDGLVCIFTSEQDLILWNPCIKQSKKLPDMGMARKHDYYGVFGFGYDKLRDDYKVVGIFCNSSVPEVEVCSLKKNSWSRIQDFKAGTFFVNSGQYVSGKLHWAASHGVNSWKIVGIDLADETYAEMEFPLSEDISFAWTLGELGGCLSVYYDYQGKCADVWVLKDFGVKGSWTKVVAVPYMDYPRTFGYSSPVCLLGNGEILLVFCSLLVLYNPKSNTFRTCPWIDPLQDVNMYVESLVSPNAHDGEKRLQ